MEFQRNVDLDAGLAEIERTDGQRRQGTMVDWPRTLFNTTELVVW